MEEKEVLTYWKHCLILVVILLIGAWVRVDNLVIWYMFPGSGTLDGQPLLTNFDGYYYLTLARDLAEGAYSSIDTFRSVPDYPLRPSTPPLLSVLIAFIVKVTPFSINWIGVLLPAVLGSLIALPLYGLGNFYGGRMAGYTAALLGVLSHYYVFRTQLGWLDTDCLNVTLPLAITWSFLQFGAGQGGKRYGYLLSGLGLYFVFLWWWDQAYHVATVLTTVPLSVAFILHYRPGRREGIVFAGLMAVAIMALLMFKGWDFPVRVVQHILSLYKYVSKHEAGDFPNIGTTVAEQARPDFYDVIMDTTDNLPLFILSLVGLLILIWKKPGHALYMSAFFLLGFFAFFHAKRFIIFLTPVLALGTGYLLAAVWQRRSKIIIIKFAVPLLVILLTVSSIQREFHDVFLPQMQPELVAGMQLAGQKSPEDAVVWSWWSFGYAINYHARRATVNDGSVHSGERTVYNGLPLAASSYRLAANFMKFYVERGVSGLHLWYQAMEGDSAKGFRLALEILDAGPDQALHILRQADPKTLGGYDSVSAWQRFFFPQHGRPVYLFINHSLLVHMAWFWMGTWDIGERNGVFLDQGENRQGQGRIPATMIRSMLDDEEQTNLFECSVFYRLFVKKELPEEYFIPISVDVSPFQLWEVRGDMSRTGRTD